MHDTKYKPIAIYKPIDKNKPGPGKIPKNLHFFAYIYRYAKKNQKKVKKNLVVRFFVVHLYPETTNKLKYKIMKQNTTTARVILDTDKKQATGLHFTLNHTGKMAGIHSLSTSCKGNEQCRKNAEIPGSICSHCFSFAMMKRYTNLDGCMQRNAEILRAGIIPDDQWPTTTGVIFRDESFGDLGNWIQAANYMNFARKNPQTRFALYTKNPRFIKEAIEHGYTKPENLIIVFSSLFLNARAKAPYDFIDKVFTVYESEDKAPEGINCGARNCFVCQRCYKKNPDGVKIEHISELLK